MANTVGRTVWGTSEMLIQVIEGKGEQTVKVSTEFQGRITGVDINNATGEVSISVKPATTRVHEFNEHGDWIKKIDCDIEVSVHGR